MAGQQLPLKADAAKQQGTGDDKLLDLLVHEKSFARLVNEFKGKAADIRPILMSDDGIFRVAGGEVIEGLPQVDLGYGTQDSYFSPAVMTYMQAILGSENLKWFQSSAAGIEHPILLAIRNHANLYTCLLYTSPSPRDRTRSRMPSSA